MIAFSEATSRFENFGAQVLGCSIDSQFVHLHWIETPRNEGGLGGLRYPLISDMDKSIARSYEVLLDGGIAARGSFLIDPEGKIRHITVNDLPVGRSVDEALRNLEAFQFTEKYGQVCPAGWTEGADTIKPSLEGSKEYFKKQ